MAINQLISKTDMKTVIVTSDRQFKRTVINFMNSIAFPAEKVMASSLEELNITLKSQKSAVNVVVDGETLLNDDNLNNYISSLEAMSNKEKLVMLVYVSKEQLEKIEKISAKKQNIFYEHSIVKATYNKVFHDSRSSKNSIFAIKPKEKKKEKENLIAVESAQHIKEAIDSLKLLTKNPKDVESLVNIGQKFNGLIGSMAFLGQKVGWKQLKEMAMCVDSMSRHYAKGLEDEIKSQHIEYLVSSAKCCFLILKCLKDFKPVETAYIEDANALIAKFKSFSEIQAIESQSQEEIDAILDKIS